MGEIEPYIKTEPAGRRGRGRRLLLAAAAVLAPAEPQSTVTLVSNLALGAESTVVAGGSNPKYASSFTTGPAGGGYGLASVALRLTSAGGSPTLDVAVHRDSSGAPGQRLFALDPPATTDCDADGAVCTQDRRPLSNRLEITVPGPGG